MITTVTTDPAEEDLSSLPARSLQRATTMADMAEEASEEADPSVEASEVSAEVPSVEAVQAEAGSYLKSVTTHEESKICDGRKAVTDLFSFTDID